MRVESRNGHSEQKKGRVHLKFGADPEVHILDKNGTAIPAHKAGFGDKNNPTHGRYTGAKMFRDGTTLEFNFPASTCRETFWVFVREAYSGAKILLEKQGYRYSAEAAVPFDPDKQLVDAPPDVMQFGCQPSFCAYELAAKVPAINAVDHDWRYGGGHLHFSTDNIESSKLKLPWCAPGEAILLNPEAYPDVVKLLDLYVGIPTTYIF